MSEEKERYRDEDCAGFVEQINWLKINSEFYYHYSIDDLNESVQVTSTLKNAKTVAIFKIKLKP